MDYSRLSFLKPKADLLPADAPVIRKELGKFIAYHALATVPWLFYEIVDNWLGPWGVSGYPLGYGKFYCIAFNENEELKADPSASKWVRSTTVKLQESILQYLVESIENGSIRNLTESRLRKAAFDSHPTCYDDAGLAMVMILAPGLIPTIISIPKKEFSPKSASFGATIMQAYLASKLVTAKISEIVIESFMPYEQNYVIKQFYNAEDYQLGQREMTYKILLRIRSKLANRQIDGIDALKRVIDLMEEMDFENLPESRNIALSNIQVASARIREIEAENGRLLILANPELRDKIVRNMKAPTK